jgi:hypothetical protein
MANRVLTNCGLWVAQYNLAGDANALSLGMQSELQDDTALADVARSRVGGLMAIAFSAEGFWNDESDQVLFEDVGLSDVPVTIAPAGLAPGDRAFLARCAVAEFSPMDGAVGELRRFTVGGEGSGIAVARGSLLHNAARTATGNAPAGFQLGAVAAGQSLHAALHITAASGTTPTLVVKIQSDDNSGFSTPTDRVTFSTATATTNLTQWSSAAGAITDDWWRVTYTITGSTPSFSFVVSAGIR